MTEQSDARELVERPMTDAPHVSVPRDWCLVPRKLVEELQEHFSDPDETDCPCRFYKELEYAAIGGNDAIARAQRLAAAPPSAQIDEGAVVEVLRAFVRWAENSEDVDYLNGQSDKIPGDAWKDLDALAGRGRAALQAASPPKAPAAGMGDALDELWTALNPEHNIEDPDEDCPICQAMQKVLAVSQSKG